MTNSLDASVTQAAIEGNISRFQTLLKNQADFKQKDRSQRIALHLPLQEN